MAFDPASQRTESVVDRITLGAAAFYAALIYVTLPPELIVINDDFGYLKSVVQTLQHGRPWTNDWLEPWAASLSGIAALVYRATGRFHLATAGVQAVLAGISFWTLAKICVDHGCTRRRALGVTLLALTIPTVLWKSLEFGGMVLHVPCLLLALFAVQRRRWGLFVLVWLIAIANRQSALSWATFPGVAVLGAWTGSPRTTLRLAWRPALVAVVGLVSWVIISRVMNKTVSQSVITDEVFHQFTPRGALPGIWMGVMTFLLAMGGGNLALRTRSISPVPRGSITTAFALVLGAIALGIDARNHLSIEHPCFGGPGGFIYTKLLAALAVAGWWTGGFKIRLDFAVCALGSLALVSLRTEVWDYYLIDIAVFGFFAVAPCETQPARGLVEREMISLRQWKYWALRAGLMGIVAFHAFFFLQLKFNLDRGLAFGSVAERALRAGQLAPPDLSFAPFGFMGWHLHPYYAAHEGKASKDIGGFDVYLRRNVAAVHTRYGGFLRTLPFFREERSIEPDQVLVHDRRRIAWFFPVDYWLVRLPAEKITPAKVPINSAEYHRVPFPLNNAEWDALIAGPAL